MSDAIWAASAAEVAASPRGIGRPCSRSQPLVRSSVSGSIGNLARAAWRDRACGGADQHLRAVLVLDPYAEVDAHCAVALRLARVEPPFRPQRLAYLHATRNLDVELPVA